MPVSAIRLRTYSTPSSDSAHSSFVCSRPQRSRTLCTSCEKPGTTKPVLRPDAFQAMRRASSSATERPRRPISSAVVKSRQPTADHADIDIEIEGQRRPAPRRSCRRGIPAGAVLEFRCCVHMASQRPRRAHGPDGTAMLGFSMPHCRHWQHGTPAIHTRGSMLRLMLLRHAKSDWSAAGTPDHERTLNARGRATAPAMGQLHGAGKAAALACAVLDGHPHPRDLRARDGGISAAARPIHYERRLYEATPETIIKIIAAITERRAHFAGDRS